jgi:hypothetical protein
MSYDIFRLKKQESPKYYMSIIQVLGTIKNYQMILKKGVVRPLLDQNLPVHWVQLL